MDIRIYGITEKTEMNGKWLRVKGGARTCRTCMTCRTCGVDRLRGKGLSGVMDLWIVASFGVNVGFGSAMLERAQHCSHSCTTVPDSWDYGKDGNGGNERKILRG